MQKIQKWFACLLAFVLLFSVALAEDTVSVDREVYERLQKYERLEEILQIIDSAYLWDYDIDTLLEGAAQGMVGALGDDYSYYYTADDVADTETSHLGRIRRAWH